MIASPGGIVSSATKVRKLEIIGREGEIDYSRWICRRWRRKHR
jgi:hypothetical protein